MEKLAIISTVLSLDPIEGADKIERATVLGWQVVTKKGQYRVGDQAVIIFPDTLVPKKYIDETYEGDEKVRLKTIKLKGQYSAGLLLPISALRTYVSLPDNVTFEEGDEVSVTLGIEKWVAPAGVSLAGDAKGNFPTAVISKTDELNFRSEPRALREVQDDPNFLNQDFIATLKCDGSSGTFIFKDGEFRVCSRNLELKETAGNVFWQVARKYKLEEALSFGGAELAIQGEVCGPGIQGNPMKLDTLTFFAFLLKDVRTYHWKDWDYTRMFCELHDIPTVPTLHRFNSINFPSNEKLQEMANDAKYDNGRSNAEGIVIRSVQPIRSVAMAKSWWSLKVMNQPYDMKKG
jgi:RNA ligase (TIGR02306 family)